MKEKILEILLKIRPESDFKGSGDFISDDLLDSFDVIELVSCLEDEFGCVIDGLDILPQNFKSLEDIEGIVSRSGGTI